MIMYTVAEDHMGENEIAQVPNVTRLKLRFWDCLEDSFFRIAYNLTNRLYK